MIEMFLDHGADPCSRNAGGQNAFQMAAYHGRRDILRELERRGFTANFEGPSPELDVLVAACALGDPGAARAMIGERADVEAPLLKMGGALLARFSGVGNVAGVRALLDLGVPVDALWPEGDPYFDVTRNATALLVASWRAEHAVVRELISRGADVNMADARGRTPLQLAVKACVDSYWSRRRQPDSVAALLGAGAKKRGIKVPTGYEAIDALLMEPQT
jgi:hypothetical protein